MNWIQRVRLLAAAALLLSLGLPAYTCSGYVGPDNVRVAHIPSGADASQYRPTQVAHYPLENQGPGELDFWHILFLYGWPIPLLAWELWRRHTGRAFHIIAALLALFSAWEISVRAFGDWASGTYLAVASNGVLLVLAAVPLWRAVVARRHMVAGAHVLLIAACIAAAGCTEPAPLVMGEFGGRLLGLEASKTSAAFQLACGQIVAQPLLEDEAGVSRVRGTAFFSGAGSTPTEAEIEVRVVDQARLRVMLTLRGTSSGPFDLVRGVEPDFSGTGCVATGVGQEGGRFR